MGIRVSVARAARWARGRQMCVPPARKERNGVPMIGRMGGGAKGCVGKGVYLDDLTAIRNEALFAPPRFVSAWLERNLNDARDMEIAVLLFNIAVTMWPAAVLLFVYPSHILGGVYFALL